ncbi:MAG: phosphatase PAP2 family protein [Actinobacteria bacterium]|nr:phosphatase PAP2 family protein [Actinomycetota bacterium]
MPSRALARPLQLQRPVWSVPALLRFAAWGAVLTVTLTGLGLALQAGEPTFDVRGLEAATAVRTDGTLVLARALTFLADLWFVAAVTALLGGWAWLRVRRLDLVWLVLAAVGGSLAVTGAVKLLSDRPRPDGGLAGTISSSFPSGHSVRGMIVYGLIAWFLLRLGSGWLRRLAASAALLLAVATGLSRIWLGVHWPTDVVAGYVLGATWLVLTLAITRPNRLTPSTSESP